MTNPAETFKSVLGLMSESDLMAVTNWTRSTLQTKRSRGTAPPHVKIGAAFFYRHEDVLNFFAERPRTKTTRTAKPCLTAQDILG
jgi:hypothetical protein